MDIYSAVVSQVIPMGFADLAQAAEDLAGVDIASGQARLKIHGHAGAGAVGAIRFAGTLRASSPLLRSVKVEVVVSPWSAGQSEVGIQPLGNLGSFDSIRFDRFFKAANSILPVLIDRLYTELPVEVPETVELAA